jgi:hypothetical protein
MGPISKIYFVFCSSATPLLESILGPQIQWWVWLKNPVTQDSIEVISKRIIIYYLPLIQNDFFIFLFSKTFAKQYFLVFMFLFEIIYFKAVVS